MHQVTINTGLIKNGMKCGISLLLKIQEIYTSKEREQSMAKVTGGGLESSF